MVAIQHIEFRGLRMSRGSIFVVLVLLVLTAVLSSCAGQSPTDGVAADADIPQFVHTASVRVQEAYRYAVANPHELENYPCYCGCGNMGHTSNLSCYIKDIDAAGNVTFDDHASGCGICVDITQDVMRLRQEGKTPLQVRAYIDATYSSFGPGTDTPLPSA